jgi:hypothetical protein
MVCFQPCLYPRAFLLLNRHLVVASFPAIVVFPVEGENYLSACAESLCWQINMTDATYGYG